MRRHLWLAAIPLVLLSATATAQEEEPVYYVLRQIPYAHVNPLVLGDDGSISGGETYYEHVSDKPFFIYRDGEADPELAQAEVGPKGEIRYRHRSPDSFETTTHPIHPKQRASEVAEFLKKLEATGMLRCQTLRLRSLYIPMAYIELKEAGAELQYETGYELTASQNFLVYPDGQSQPVFPTAKIVTSEDGKTKKIEYTYRSETRFEAQSHLRD